MAGSAEIAHTYRMILGREGSPEEIAAWQGTGLTGQQLFATFSAEAARELSARPGAAMPTDNQAMVRANYQNLVGRAPSAEEEAAWRGSGLSGEDLYRSMAQAAQAEQQTRGTPPPAPPPQDSNFAQRADTIATFLGPRDNGGGGGGAPTPTPDPNAQFLGPRDNGGGGGGAPTPTPDPNAQFREMFDEAMRGVNSRFDSLQGQLTAGQGQGASPSPSPSTGADATPTSPGTGAGRSTSVRRGSFALGGAPNSRFGGTRAQGFVGGGVGDDGNASKYTPTSRLSKIDP